VSRRLSRTPSSPPTHARVSRRGVSSEAVTSLPRRLFWIALWALGALGCGDEGVALSVDLLTDYRPGYEFALVEVYVDGKRVGDLAALRTQDFVAGLRVADVDDLAASDQRAVELRLIDVSGERVVTRPVTLRHREDYAVTVVIARSCADVTCGASEVCLAGECVDPRCTPEAPEYCPPEPECAASSECGPVVACADAVCAEGACFVAPDESRCGAGEYCAPDRGCSPDPFAEPFDAGPPDLGPPDLGPPDLGPPDLGPPDLGMPDAGPLGVPTGLRVTASGQNAVDVTWTGVMDASSYRVQVSGASGFTSPMELEVGSTDARVSGLLPGRRYWARVLALAADGRESEWSSSANGVTAIDSPGRPSVDVTIPGATRSASQGGWVDPPDPGTWFYARGRAASSCPSGTTIRYRFQAQYTSPTTLYGWTGWMGRDAYMVQPTSGWGVRFFAQARCEGRDANSSPSSTGSGCRMSGGGSC